MRSRLLTAFGLGVLLIVAVLHSSPAVTAAILGLIVLIGAWEWSAFLSVTAPWRLLYVLVLGALGVAGFCYTRDVAFAPTRLLWLMELAVAWWLVALIWIIWVPSHVGRAAAGLAGVLALVPTWIALVRIDARWAHGAQWTLFILALAFAADTGAFFVGRKFGRAHLAPRVSPNKTWEGVIGGMMLALLIAWIGTLWFRQRAGGFVPLCLAASAFSVIGDLTESLLKRHVHLKDSGRLFPGHGGVLDRIDSVTAATPVMALGLIWLGAGQ